MISKLKNTKSILIGLICLVYVGLFFSVRVTNITIVAILLYCLIKTSPGEFLHSLKSNLFPQIMLLLYLLYILGMLYTSNYKTGFFVLEKKLMLLLFPLLLLPLLQREKIGHSIVYKAIGFITVLSSIILLCIAAYKKFILSDSQAFYFENFTIPLMHYVYYAIYFAIGSLFLLDSLYDILIQKKYGGIFLGTLFIYCLCFLVLVASKTGIIAFSFASIVILYKRISDKRVFGISMMVLVLSAFSFLYFNDTTRSRFTELTQNLSILTRDELGDWQEEVLTGLNLRLLFWKISVINSWNDGHFLTGVGTGDTQDYLNSLYTNPKYNREGYVGWDSHNEWVFTYLQVGILGVVTLAFLYHVFVRKSLLMNDMKLLSFLSITFAFSMSESILESNKGIVFFALFFTLLSSAYDNKLKPETKISN